MNQRIIAYAVIACISVGSAMAQEQYNVPGDLKPMSTWRYGWSAEETRKYRQQFNDNTLTGGADDGAYAITHLSEVLPTAIVHRDGLVAELKSAPMLEIERVVAKTALGTLTLRQMMDDRRSRIRAIAVVHKGIVAPQQLCSLPTRSCRSRSEPGTRANCPKRKFAPSEVASWCSEEPIFAALSIS